MSDVVGQAAAALARSRLLLQAAETINSSLDSPSLALTILGEAARLIGADAAALLSVRGDVLVAGDVLGLGDRVRDAFVVPLETSVYGRALVTGEVVVEALGEAGSPLRSRTGNAVAHGARRSAAQQPHDLWHARAVLPGAPAFGEEERACCAPSPCRRRSRSTTAT